MNPRYRIFLKKCKSEGEEPKNYKYQAFISDNLKEFYEKIGKDNGRRMTDEEHEQFTEFLINKYSIRKAV